MPKELILFEIGFFDVAVIYLFIFCGVIRLKSHKYDSKICGETV